MDDEQPILQLLERMLESGSTPEEACAACPELLPTVRERWKQIQGVGAQLEAFFPDSGAAAERPPRMRDDLPQIPGYEVEAILGHGGMGVVYKTLHQKLDRVVALKMLLSGAYASTIELARFTREARAIAGLRHAHLVQVYDIGELDGCPYFTMEFMEGGSLAEKLGGVPQPPQKAATLLALLASAVQAAHDGGIVHRDLKPSNILLTADGTPKISDFGLARRVEDEADLTVSGARMGTPSYMAPEQVTNRHGEVGPHADVYALGAVLYEMLTGRPPFRADTVSDTERQLIADEPVPPSRLNSKVPRDLETICLKCLRKDPVQRYATAADLAADADRYLRGEPIIARPVGRTERAVKWVRRHRAATVAMAAGMVTAATVVSATAWTVSQKMAIASAAAADLQKAAALQQKADWTGADEAIDRAALRLGTDGPAALHAKIQQERSESELVSKLEQIRDKNEGDDRSLARVNEAYARLFHDAGLGGEDDPPAVVARRIGAMNVSPALVAALDDWTACLLTERRRNWVLAVLRIADHDPTGWRDHIRDPAVWSDIPRLSQEVEGADIASQPVTFIIAIAKQLQLPENKARSLFSDKTALSLLTLLQRAHPDDFWANIALGNALGNSDPDAACAFFRAAVSLEPNNYLPHNNLGTALRNRGREEEAMQEFQRAVALGPDADVPVANLSLGLATLGRKQEALDALAAALKRGGPHPNINLTYGDMLLERGRTADALEQYRHYAFGEPPNWATLRDMRRCLIRLGRSDEMLADWRKAIDTASPFEGDYDGYAEYALFTGQQSEYERVRRILLDKFGDASEPSACTRIARACLLAPISGKDLVTASALADRAAASLTNKSLRNYYYFQFCRGLALYRQGRSREAGTLLSQVGGNSFLSCALAITSMIRQQAGDSTGALKDLAAASITFDWSARFADEQTDWMYHILRREAEKTVLPNLPAFLQGSYQPTGSDERVAMTAELQFEGRNLARAQLWRDLLGSLPSPPAGYRFRAASVAVLVSEGIGTDVSGLSIADRAQWRAAALRWLQADLDRFERRSSDADKAMSHGELALWQTEDYLAYVRKSQPTFTAEESSQWKSLWERVQSLYDRTKQGVQR